jgi:hypothetical protein
MFGRYAAAHTYYRAASVREDKLMDMAMLFPPTVKAHPGLGFLNVSQKKKDLD